MKLVIVGASGHGKVLADLAEKLGYEDVTFLDDDRSRRSCLGRPVVGGLEKAVDYPNHEFVVAVGNAAVRRAIQEKLEAEGLRLATLIHPASTVGKDVTLGAGTVVMAGAVINPSTRLGKGCIVNTGATVDHDNLLGDYVHVSVGSHLAGTVTVGDQVWIGAGAVVSNNLTLCSDCVLGAGAVVVKDVTEPGTYVGVPARRLEDKTGPTTGETEGGQCK